MRFCAGHSGRPGTALCEILSRRFRFKTVRFAVAGISFVQQNALCFAPFYHGSKPWVLANIGRGGMDFIHEPVCIAPSKTLVA